MSEPKHKRKCASQNGFALPLALVAIAAMAIIAGIGFRAVSDSTTVLGALQTDAATERALISAESEAVFVFLTSPPIAGGIATGQQLTTDANAVFDAIDPAELQQSEYWQAHGQARISQTAAQPVHVIYRDASGLASMTSLPEDRLAELLQRAGFDREDALKFAARIADYQDENANRRFRGAERADYRLFSASPPTDSPLRAYQETSSVLGIMDNAPNGFWDYLAEYCRFNGEGGSFKPRFAPAEIADLFSGEDSSVLGRDAVIAAAAEDRNPTDTARFLLETATVNGLTRRRAVEIMRTAAAADMPFQREWIYDKADANDSSAIAAINQEDLAQVFQAESGSDSR